MSEAEPPQSFWSTLPGLLTAIGGLITAVAALLAAFVGLGVFHPAEPTPAVTPVVMAVTPIAATPTVTRPDGVSPTAEGTLLVPAVESDTWDETFADPASGWDTYVDGDMVMGYQDGEYRIAVLQAAVTVWAKPSPPHEFADAIVEVDTRQVEGTLNNSLGLVLRVQPEDSGLLHFVISSDGHYAVDRYQDEQWVTLVDWTESEAIRQDLNAVNRLQVVCDRSKFSFLVNDTLLTELIDNTYATGNIGLSVGTFDEGGVVVHFDNLRVQPLSAP